MGKEFFHRDMQLFIDHRVDWERYFRLRAATTVERRRGGRDLQDDPRAPSARSARTSRPARATTGTRRCGSRTARSSCRRTSPPATRSCAQAGLVCLTLEPEYGGYGLPSLLNCAYLEMVARADSSLMTIVGLQAGVAQRHREVRQRRAQAALPAALRRGRAAGLHGPDRAAGRLGPRRHRHARRREEGDRYFIDGEKIFITNGGADDPPGAGARRRDLRPVEAARRTASA